MIKYWWLAPVAALVAQMLVVSPVGEFPLNDDWVAALSVQRSLETGAMVYPPYLAPYHLVPILAGIGISRFFVFSFSLLRLIGIASAVGCVVLLYFWLRGNSRSPWVVVFACLILWLNPLFFNLSYTFMSDVPALFLLLAAVFSYQRGFVRGNHWWLMAGSLFAVAGFFTRQVVLLILLTAALQYLFSSRRRWRSVLIAFGFPLFGVVILAMILQRFDIMPGEVGAKWLPSGWSYLRHALSVGSAHALVLSLFFAPVTIALYVKNAAWFRQPLLWVAAISLGMAAWVSNDAGYFFPSLGNIINRSGIGPAASVLQGDVSLFGPSWVYTLSSVLSAALISFHLFAFVVYIRNYKHERGHLTFLWIFSVIYFLMILFVRSFDRYLLLLMPAILWYSAMILERFLWSRPVAFSLMLVLGMYSIIGTGHYLAWNKARWTLGNRLQASGIPAESIEGGYEWNGWHMYYSGREHSLGASTPEWAPWYVKQLAPQHQMEYIISFAPVGGYRVVDRESVAFGPFGVQELYASIVQPGSLK